jgi:hypothetical protein
MFISDKRTVGRDPKVSNFEEIFSTPDSAELNVQSSTPPLIERQLLYHTCCACCLDKTTQAELERSFFTYDQLRGKIISMNGTSFERNTS